ncbi:MAG: prepilin-type N-terminal cleavage/methylation domain-containing protein [Opitutaceae bacterium]
MPNSSSTAWPCRSRSRGFTLLEVLLSIAIIGLVATVLVSGSARLLSEQPVTPTEIFWRSVQEARKAALKSGHEVRLKFEKEKRRFVLFDGLAPSTLAADGFTREEVPLKTFPISAAAAAGDLAVEFLGAGTKGGSVILVGGVMLETQTVPFVTFYADGTCTAFRAQFSRTGGANLLSIDPWTCAPVLTPVDPNSLPP